MDKTCNRCDNGKPRYELVDARGIFVTFVCEDCEKSVKAKYRPEIFADSQYDCDEQIDEDY
jgi:transposase-like protein